MYALYFILVAVLCCIMMSETVANEMKEHVSLPLFELFQFLMVNEGVWEKFNSEGGTVPPEGGLGYVLALTEPS